MDKTIYNHTKCCRQTSHLLLVLIIVLLVQSCKTNSSAIRILFTGDILLSRNVRAEIQSRKTSPWTDLKPLFQSADLVIGNLEGAVGKNEGKALTDSGAPVFDIDKDQISLLSEAGFKIITLENNHSYDLGVSGKEKTIEILRKCNITPVYFENSPQFFTVKDVIIALLAINIVPGMDLFRNQVPSIELKQKLRLAGSLANIVVVSIHWGSEFLDWPNREQRETTQWLIHNGADIIIGSHPHVIQKPEMIEGKPVFFSLGNHLFDQKYPRTKEGLIVDLRIGKGNYKFNGIITHTKANSFYPVITDYTNYHLKCLPINNNTVKINGYTLKPLSTVDSNQNKIVIEGFREGKKIWHSSPMPIVSIASGKLDGENEYLFMLERHYSSLDGEISLRPYVYNVGFMGLIAKWRGSALAWPLLDACISPFDKMVLCALHRGDSFITLDKTSKNTRVSAYKWNGFGFTGISDSVICKSCQTLFNK
jgi:poly-gamma-glutamate synthesis protein (capsule biosynthesis protein)